MATGFMSTMMTFFGKKENQTAMEFAGELNKLNYREKMEFHKMLNDAGHPCDAPVKKVGDVE